MTCNIRPSQNLKTPAPHIREKLYLSRAMPPRVIVGALCLNCHTFDLEIDRRIIRLTPAEFDLLYYFMSHSGEIFSAEELLCHVWQYPPGAGKSNLVRAHIKNLRLKIEPDPPKPIRLVTVGRLGYTIAGN